MKKFLLLIALIISGLGLNAQSVGSSSIVYYDGYSLKFTVTKLDPAECKVVCDTKPTTPIAVSIPSSVTIEGSTFSVTSIGNSAFSYCSKLTSIEIPNSVTSIGNYAFYSCSGLTSIEIPNSVTSIGNDAFSSCDGLESFVVEGGNPNYDSRNNCNAIIETQTNTLLYGCMNTIIPNSVTSIGNSAFYYCSGLTSIEIPNSVTSIGNEAFSFCSGLTSIEIPNSVTSIGISAFYYCSGLTSIEIPNSVTSIGNEAFYNCDGLESFVVEGGNPNYDSRNNCNAIIETQTNTLLYGCMNTIIPNSVTSIGNRAFYSCDGLTSIEIPNSVTSIGNSAFSSCYGLESFVVEGGNPNYDSRDNCNAIIETQTNTLLYGCMNTIIPNSVTSIGNEAFSYCFGLTSIEIPNSVTSIGNEAFSYCSGLTSIEIPNSVTSIGYYAFHSCSGLTSIEIPNSVTSIGESAFLWCSHLRSIKCHAVDVPVTATNAFNYCPEDMTIQVPEESVALYQAAEPWKNYNVTEIHLYQIGDYVVVDYEGYSLRYTIIKLEPAECEVICETKPTTEISITIPSSVEMEGVVCNVTKIGNEAFRYCSKLTSIEIPNSVTSIGESAFYYCSGLTSIEIPNSVTSIGDRAFSFCSGLTSIEIPNSVTSIGNSAFSSCDGLESFVVEGGNPNYDSRNNCNAIIETQTNTLLYGCMNTIIPNSVTSIGNHAFFSCSGLTSIEIPNSVTSIGNYAFSDCSGLTSIEIPNSVTSIGNRAFYNCSGLTSIEIPNSVTSIGNSAFSSCDGLESFVVENGNTVYDSRNNCNAIIETQTNTLLYGCMNTIIPNSVTSIGNSAFSYCSKLTSIEIPNSVTSIGYEAFIFCSKLTSIEIPNSVTSIGDFAFYYCSGLTSIEIPNSVTSIGERAFLWCSHLRSIKCHAVDVPVTATNAFNYCPEDMTIQVPEESVASYQAAEPWKNYNIVAGFNSTINLTSNIEEGGFVEGSGNYQDGTEITVYAYVNPNYGFLYWSENDEIVSYCPNYSFIVSEDRNLVANFAINHWIPDYTIYPNFIAITGVVQIDGIEQSDSNIEVGAFCGDELRGSNRLIYECEYDRYYLYLTIYGKDDDEISFRIYDNSEETELELYYNETMNFIVDDIVGNVGDPKIFNFTTDYIHKQQLTSNWNWYSTFVDVDGREGFEMMKEGLGEFGIQIKSQSVFSNYNAGNWNGVLNTVSTGNMYMIKVSEPIELSMSGVIVEPSEFPIVINTNWKWIPYPVQEEMDIASAFAGFTPNDGDILKSQDGFTQYYQGIGWNGSLNTMMPGQGYMYQNTSGEEKILYYPTQGENRNALKANVTTENNYWKPEVTEYPTNMNVIAVVNNASDDYEIGAFCNGECRGSARPLYIEGLDKHIVFMTVYGDEEETIYLKYYDINNDEEYAVSDAFTFTVNAVLGNTMNPYVISLVPANVGEISTNGLNIYPNPANVNDAINFTREYEKVEIYNALGVKIAEYENRDYIDGIENAGIYVIKITDDGMTEYDRIIVN